MERTRRTHTIFTLQQARELLPQVQHMTADAVRRAEALTAELQKLREDDPLQPQLSAALHEVVDEWIDALRALGVDAKGLWLADFDNGEGYYCWRYPEATIAHFHGYDEGFSGRITIQ
jgi:hypothetical protein